MLRGNGDVYLTEFASYPMLTRWCVGHTVSLIRSTEKECANIGMAALHIIGHWVPYIVG